MCNAKVGIGKHDTLAPTYKGLTKEFRSPNNVEYEFWFCHDDFKHCVSGSKNEYVLDWPIGPNTWPVKIGTNLSREEVQTYPSLKPLLEYPLPYITLDNILALQLCFQFSL